MSTATTTPYEFKVLTPAQVDMIRALQKQIGAGNAAKGFRDEGNDVRWLVGHAATARAPFIGGVIDKLVKTVARLVPSIERSYWTARLSLLTTEVAEGIEELRKGRRVNETYYVSGNVEYERTGNGEYISSNRVFNDQVAYDFDGKPPKPEGVPSEVADVVIRALDYADEAKFDLAEIIDIKLAYNATRAHMHGKKA